MLSLFLKEYYMLRWFIILYLPSMFLYGGVFSVYSIMILIWTSKYYEIQNNSEMLINSLPISRIDVVRSKYVSMIAAALLFILMIYIGQMTSIGQLFFEGYDVDFFKLYLEFAMGIAIGLPIYYLIPGVYLSMVVTGAMSWFLLLGIDLLNTAFGAQYWLLLCVASIIILWLSYLISVATYKRKEF